MCDFDEWPETLIGFRSDLNHLDLPEWAPSSRTLGITRGDSGLARGEFSQRASVEAPPPSVS